MIGIYEIEDTETEVNITREYYDEWFLDNGEDCIVVFAAGYGLYGVTILGEEKPSTYKDTLQEAKLYALALIIRNS